MTLKELHNLLKELDERCGICNRCGICQSVCPVFKASGFEADVARGKIALLDGLTRQILDHPDRVLERLNRCLLCGACEKSCSRKVDLLALFLTARSIITGYTGLSPLKKILFRVLLSRPALFDSLFRFIYRFQGLFLKYSKDDNRLAKVRAGVPLLKDRRVPPIAAQPFRPSVSDHFSFQVEKQDNRLPKVVFFTGCLIDKVMPHVGHACIKVLECARVDFRVIANEACCGMPALSAGDTVSFQSLLSHNLSSIYEQEFDVLVTACATCTMTIRDLWPKMNKNARLSGRIADVSGRVMDIGEFVMTRTGLLEDMSLFNSDSAVGRAFARHDNAGESPPYKTSARSEYRIPVTWHDPCHLKHKTDTGHLARKCLNVLPGYRFTEMREAGVCCGSGGSFNLTHYDLAQKIGDRKGDNIRESGAVLVSTACPACMIRLSEILAEKGSDIQVRHFMEILADSL